MNLYLEGKVALVTGGAVGIGKGIVSCLAREGAHVVIADLDLKAAEKTAKELGNNVEAVKLDVTDKKEVESIVKSIQEKHGKIDILVNNAGISRPIKFVDIEPEEWDQKFKVNVKGVYLITREVLPGMMERRYGKIINIASMVAKEAIPDFSHYSSTKFAVMGLTQALAKECSEYDINVNAVCPGVVRTALWNDVLLPAMAAEQGITEDEAFDNFCASIPLKRAQNPEDIGNMVAYLASDIARNMTGQGINVTSGQQMH
jgi:meso-butanediol dehydrogenase / (S,S)-butanediol dehydrogenase / diacetyl reductase